MQCVYTCKSWGLAFTDSRIPGAVMPSTGTDMKSYHHRRAGGCCVSGFASTLHP